MGVQSPTEIKPPADCRDAQMKMSAKLTRIPQQERRGVLENYFLDYQIAVSCGTAILARGYFRGKVKERDKFWTIK